ncbi:amidase [Stappia taiwanensis]|uniref:Amidase n=1 Tax=Stappia taiwanensis TaxID=992267 RepID=A0A838XL71_9HYPH|nr:amidase [Stappia taiwanensis]MBA4612069.1 amidase [Stappia taiwanensis]GGE91326.1 amidase [Stappia taiwanensis]
MSDPTTLSARELSTAIHARQLSCREVMAAFLSRIDAQNPAINAIVSLRPAEELLAEAEARDQELARGLSRGWMHGFPHAVKDLSMTAGLVTSMGSPLFARFKPDEDSIHAARIRAAGAIFIGKTNTPEFGLGSHTYNPLFGPTRNPYDLSRSAGGSSGGAAAALAARLVPVADGSDMMGSLRNPAAFTNVIGFRPSYGRVPGGPGPELFMDTMATDGPMARSVGDLAMLLAVQAGYDPRAPQSLDGDGQEFAGELRSSVKGLRIGWLGDFGGYLPFEDGILDLNRKALDVLAGLGAHVEETGTGFDMERLWQAWVALRQWRVAAKLAQLYDDPQKREHLKPEAIWEIEGGRALDMQAIEAASLTRSAWHRAVLSLFGKYDYLVAPSAQVFPFDVDLDWPKAIAGRTMDTYHRWMEVVVGVSILGLPAIALPAGFGPGGLPTGFQLIGRPRDDLGLLACAKAYDAATDWTERTPGNA